MNLNHTLDQHHKDFPHWLAGQRDGQTWQKNNPYVCPVARYLASKYPGERIIVWKDSLWIGKATILLQPQHRFRRLLVLIMFANGQSETITKERVMEHVRQVWRTEYEDPDKKFDVVKFRQRRRAVAAQQREIWGW